MSKVRFVNRDSDNGCYQKAGSKLYRFYQICQFRNKVSNRYKIRNIIFDEMGEIVKIYEKHYTSDQCKILISSCKSHEYKIYPTWDLELVDYPNADDILKLKSPLVSSQIDDSNYGNYAKF